MIDISDNTINPIHAQPIHLLKQYLNALVESIAKENLPKEVNLIFDSGAVNGLLGTGAALYIQKLADNNLIKVNKIAGCSIGSLIAVWYKCGCPDGLYSYMDTLFAHYKTEQNFYIFESIVRDIIHLLFLDDDMTKINECVYINYYDTLDNKQIVISHFLNRAHLIESILRSSHVPYMTGQSHKREGRYIDGIAPYIFPTEKHCKNLFIKLINIVNPLECLKIKSERNIYTRLLRGLTKTNDFFVNGDTEICSYINYRLRLQFFVRKYFVLFIIFLMDGFIKLRNKLPPSLCECHCYKMLGRFASRGWCYGFNIMLMEI
jgi:hypothetical protein